jgi:DNA repair protein RadC
MSIFNESELELIFAAKLILSDGVQRIKGRTSLLPCSRSRDVTTECREARQIISDTLIASYGSLRHETAIVVLLDAQGQLIEMVELPRGKSTSVEVRYRLIAEAIIKHDAEAILLAHNHPSGECSPSKADVTLTHSLASWLKAMEVTLVDHLVITGDDYCSILGTWG